VVTAVRAALVALLGGTALVASGCTGILGISPGTSSDGQLGAPCDVMSSSPTPCAVAALVCVLNVCRSPCDSDSDCAADARCLARDSNGGSINLSTPNASADYGCVPLTSTSCSSDGCPSPDVCDPQGQCRTSCNSDNFGCASGQVCEHSGGISACYGPHDGDGGISATHPTNDAGGNDSEADDGGEEASTMECSGTPYQTTCAGCYDAYGACSCPGCAEPAVAGTCSGGASATSCAECGTEYDCEAIYCPGCTIAAPVTACYGTPTYASCTRCPIEYCGSSAYPEYCQGCMVGPPACTGTIPYSCQTIGEDYGETVCTGAGCTWDTNTDTCTGVPSCSTATTEGECEASEGLCEWSSGTCTGTITPCSAQPTEAVCEDEEGCEWTTSTCSGTITTCTSLTTESACDAQRLCSWDAAGASSCTGFVTPCTALSVTDTDGGPSPCESQPGCFVNATGGSAAPSTF
jgi:hypothetical protein